MTEPAFAEAYAAAQALVTGTPALLAFAGWPEAEPSTKPSRPIPAAEILQGWSADPTAATTDLTHAIQQLAPHVYWRQTYREAEVGADFLARYGYFELVGPNGHFHSDAIRVCIAFWDTHLDYPWHDHEAEELYIILAGRALFRADGEPSEILGPGDIKTHSAWQPHAMVTTDSPVLALTIWRGTALESAPALLAS